MLDPNNVSDRLREHFQQVSPEEFRANVDRFTPPDKNSTSKLAAQPDTDCEPGNQLVLFQPTAAALPLDAYLACALSGLEDSQRQLMFHISDTVASLCREQNINLYEPRRATDPVHHAHVADSEVYRLDREKVLKSDLLIHLCHFPSTGSGEELDFAHSALLPIILISHSNTRVSRMVTGIPSFKLHITYTEPEQLREELRDRLSEIRPILEERKLAFSQYDSNLVGDRIRALREDQGLTRDDIARSAPHLTVDALRQIEESTDRVGNPNLIQLREIATVLKTTVADIVEPDLSERLVGTLQEWVANKTNNAAARFDGLNDRDRLKLIRKVLLRLIDVSE